MIGSRSVRNDAVAQWLVFDTLRSPLLCGLCVKSFVDRSEKG